MAAQRRESLVEVGEGVRRGGAGHVARLDQAERVVHAQRRQDANVALAEHGDRRERGRADDRRLEGGNLLKERKGDNGLRHHD